MQKWKHDVWVGLFVLFGAGAILFLALVLGSGSLLTSCIVSQPAYGTAPVAVAHHYHPHLHPHPQGAHHHHPHAPPHYGAPDHHHAL